MIGAIVGDVVGSRFEWHNIRTKNFALFADGCFATDDSVMTLAVARAILDCAGEPDRLGDAAVRAMQTLGRRYPDRGYGSRFSAWLQTDAPAPYYSYGNGAAMRVGACGCAAESLGEAIALSRAATEVTHNHPEGLKGAEATAVSVFLARRGDSIERIRAYVEAHYYELDFTLDGIRAGYRFDESCQGTVPQALTAFFESADFEDAIRNAVSIGGDSDTLAAIAGAVAGAYYGVPEAIKARALTYLDADLKAILFDFERAYSQKAAPGARH